MKLTEQQRDILLALIIDEKEVYKKHGLLIDSNYKEQLDILEEKMKSGQVNFEKQLKQSMCDHSAREDW